VFELSCALAGRAERSLPGEIRSFLETEEGAMTHTERRVVFDFVIAFTNGGGIQGQDFRLDIAGAGGRARSTRPCSGRAS
jgi:hypothetical protein